MTENVIRWFSHPSPVTAIAWGPRSSDSVPMQLHFATAGTDGVVRIFDGTFSNSEENLVSYSHNIFFSLVYYFVAVYLQEYFICVLHCLERRIVQRCLPVRFSWRKGWRPANSKKLRGSFGRFKLSCCYLVIISLI